MHVGPLIGTRTWGGLVGIGGYPPLIDGGTVTTPRWAVYDPQLEKAVSVLMQEIAARPATEFPRPPYPDHRPRLPPP